MEFKMKFPKSKTVLNTYFFGATINSRNKGASIIVRTKSGKWLNINHIIDKYAKFNREAAYNKVKSACND